MLQCEVFRFLDTSFEASVSNVTSLDFTKHIYTIKPDLHVQVRRAVKQSHGFQANEASDVINRAFGKTNQAPIQCFNVRCFVFSILRSFEASVSNVTSLDFTKHIYQKRND